MHLIAAPGRQHGDAGREHPERTPERDRRVARQLADVEGLGVRDVVELRAAGQACARRQRDVELLRQRWHGHVAILAPRGEAASGGCATVPRMTRRERTPASLHGVPAGRELRRRGDGRRRPRRCDPDGPRGDPTPAFMPVGTKATVKSLHPDEVRALGAQVMLGNTYHLHLRPGRRGDRGARRAACVLGLGRPDPDRLGRVPGVLAARHAPRRRRRRRHVPVGLRRQAERLTPEHVAEIQRRLGSDIAMCLDICPPADSSPREHEDAVRRTTLWAERQVDAPRAAGPAPLRHRAGRRRRRATAAVDRRDHGARRSTASRSAGSRSARAGRRCSNGRLGGAARSRRSGRGTSWASATPRGSSR